MPAAPGRKNIRAVFIVCNKKGVRKIKKKQTAPAAPGRKNVGMISCRVKGLKHYEINCKDFKSGFWSGTQNTFMLYLCFVTHVIGEPERDPVDPWR